MKIPWFIELLIILLVPLAAIIAVVEAGASTFRRKHDDYNCRIHKQ